MCVYGAESNLLGSKLLYAVYSSCMYNVSMALDMKVCAIGIFERSDRDKSRAVKKVIWVITVLNLPMMKRERENEWALKC